MGWAARHNPIAQAAAERSPDLEQVVDQQRIRELAAHIQTEAQLQHILDQVQPSSIRDEVERQIRPWVAFTRPPLLGPDGELIMPEPVVQITPTDPADAESAALLEAAVSREVLSQELADRCTCRWLHCPAKTGDGPCINACTCNRFGCRAQTGDGPCDGGEAFARTLRSAEIRSGNGQPFCINRPYDVDPAGE